VRFKQSCDLDVIRGSYYHHWSLKRPRINDPGTWRHGWIPWLVRWRRSITRTNSTDVEKEYQTNVIKVEATSKIFFFVCFSYPVKFLPGKFQVGCGFPIGFTKIVSASERLLLVHGLVFCVRCKNSRNSKLLTLPLAIRWLAVVVDALLAIVYVLVYISANLSFKQKQKLFTVTILWWSPELFFCHDYIFFRVTCGDVKVTSLFFFFFFYW
jgi:hypothetical protein